MVSALVRSSLRYIKPIETEDLHIITWPHNKKLFSYLFSIKTAGLSKYKTL